MRYPTLRQTYRSEALERQRGACYYCHSPLPEWSATADHLWPVSKKGKVHPKNIVASCSNCNRIKGNIPYLEFYKMTKKSKPARGVSDEILMIWVSRRIWKRTRAACDRIERAAGISTAPIPIPRFTPVSADTPGAGVCPDLGATPI